MNDGTLLAPGSRTKIVSPRRAVRRRCAPATGALAVACALAVGCGSGAEGTGAGGRGGQGQGGTTAGAAAGTTGSGGTAGSAAGRGGQAGGGNAGAIGSGGSGAVAGAPGGQSGSAAGGRGGSAGAGAGGVAGLAGAAGSGAAGSGAGGTGGGSSAVTPTKVGDRYRFAFGDVVFEIDPTAGGRVATLSLSGAHIIVPSGTESTTWGSVFWTSPRSDWTPRTWPPPDAWDTATFNASITGGTHVVVTGPTDSGLGISMRKDYAADASSGWITIAYTVNAMRQRRAAPWEVSRVPRGGIVFFPVPSGGAVTAGPLTVTQSGGIAWFDDGPRTATSPDGDKCFADGAGWTAYVVGGNLFLKKFMDQPASAQAAGEGEVDIYPGDGFLEFEVQGPYTNIPASGTLPWSIQWRVVKVPSSVTIAVNSTTLVDFARQQIALP